MPTSPNIDDIDFNELYELVLDASRKAFRFAQESHPDETFYAFILYHHDWLGYMFPSCNTEEALKRSYDKAGIDPSSLGDLAIFDRWSPCDWDYHLLGDQFFEAVRQWFQDFNQARWEINQQLLDPNQEDNDAIFNDFHTFCQNQMISIARRVLKTLDEEKLFGEGLVREQVVLNIMQGDQGMDWLDHARYLNPPTVHEKWCAAIEAAYEAVRKRSHRL